MTTLEAFFGSINRKKYRARGVNIIAVSSSMKFVADSIPETDMKEVNIKE